jgi:hypothetical protein
MPARPGLKSFESVFPTFARQFLDAVDVPRSQIGEEFDHHLPLGGFHDERVFTVLDLGHVKNPFLEMISCQRQCVP